MSGDSLCQAYNNHCWHYRCHTLWDVNEGRNEKKKENSKEGRKNEIYDGRKVRSEVVRVAARREVQRRRERGERKGGSGKETGEKEEG